MCPFVVRESFSSGRPLNKIVTGIRPPEPDELNSDDHFKNKLNFFLPAFSSFSGFLPPLFFFCPQLFEIYYFLNITTEKDPPFSSFFLLAFSLPVKILRLKTRILKSILCRADRRAGITGWPNRSQREFGYILIIKMEKLLLCMTTKNNSYYWIALFQIILVIV